MLEPWALNFRKWKKRIAWAVYQGNDLLSANAFHATSEEEYRAIRRLGLTQPVAVVPNGLEIPASVTADVARRKPDVEGVKHALYLGRLHPKKNIPSLIDAWGRFRPRGWMLRIVGPGSTDYVRFLKSRVTSLRLDRTIYVHDEVDDEEKWRLMCTSRLFILPTFSENFGNVVAEAMASAIPVITTTGTPWSILKELGCGWYVEPTVDCIEAALRSAIALSDAERYIMGQRGRAFVESEVSADACATKMIDFYAAVIGSGAWPQHVRLD